MAFLTCLIKKTEDTFTVQIFPLVVNESHKQFDECNFVSYLDHLTLNLLSFKAQSQIMQYSKDLSLV